VASFGARWSSIPASSLLAPGLVAAVCVAALSVVIGWLQQASLRQVYVEPLVVALLLGIVLRNVGPAAPALTAGASFAAKQVLEVAVVVLGITLNFHQVLGAGINLVGLIVIVVGSAIGVSYLIGRSVGLAPRLAILVAVGNAICGNSAIAAVAPVIGAAKKDVASAIALTAVIGVCLVIGLPLLIPVLGLDDYQYGVLAGMSVYAVPQVVAAAFPVSQLAGQVATLVKLIRILLLGPVVLLFALGARRNGQAVEGRKGWSSYLPWFVAGFLVLALARNLGLLPDPMVGVARDVSGILMTVAMAGLGYGVHLADVRAVGPRVALAVVASLGFIAGMTLLHVHLLGIHQLPI
jgi:uncharacterized integral membrane protein (TIGR00698 family)